jgi:Glycosyl hydrolase family 26
MNRTVTAAVAVAAMLVALLAGIRIYDGAFHRGHARPPAAGGYLGVAEPDELTSYRQVNQFAASTGRKPDIVLYYSSWLDPFQTRFAAKVHAHGAIPFVQINPGDASMASVAAGHYDAYLRSYADEVRAYRHQVIVGFAPEMNGPWNSWGWRHTSPATWIAAWRHVVTLFRGQHADNVTWLWTINLAGRGSGPIRDWWPGDSYVTWVGIDGYYFLRSDTFSSSFQPTIAAVRRLTTLPILLSEVGIGQVAGQAAKLPDLFAGLGRSHLLGFVWFDEAQHQGIYHQDWRLENNPAGLAQFRREVKNYRELKDHKTHRPATGS